MDGILKNTGLSTDMAIRGEDGFFAVRKEGERLLTRAGDTVRLWDVKTGKQTMQFNGHKDYVSSVAFSPDGRWDGGVPAGKRFVSHYLREAGYATACFGKWHLGDFATHPKYNPLRHGFDFYFGVPHSNDMHPFPLYRGEEQLLANADLGPAPEASDPGTMGPAPEDSGEE